MMSDAWPLRDIRVLELSRFVGAAYAGKLLGELGADVVAVEPITGHPLRSRPIHAGTPSTSLFDYCSTNKRLVALDVAAPSAAAVVQRLARDADILVSDYPAAELAAMLDAGGAPHALSEKLIVVRLKPFVGPDREQPASYFSAYHSGGESYLTPGGAQYVSRPPVRVAQYAGEYDVGLQAAIAALTALYARQAGLIGGEWVEVSVQGAVANIARAALGHYTTKARVLESRANRGERLGTAIPCKDGLVEIMAPDDVAWFRLVEVIGSPSWAYAPELTDIFGRYARSAELNTRIAEWTRSFTKHEVRDLCQAAHVPCGSVESIDDVLGWDQLAHRGFFRAADGGGLYPGLPFTLADAALPPATACREILAGAALAWADQERGSANPERKGAWGGVSRHPADRPLPLAGIRVVEFSWYWAVPFTGMLLAALGAEVIKIESRSRLDPMRYLNAEWDAGEHLHETSFMFHDVNLGKRSITLDLGTPEGRQIAIELVKRCDVVLQNYSVGVLARLGLGYDVLQAANPKVIIVSETAGGEEGPASHYVGFATIFGALSGLGASTGYGDSIATDLRDSADLRVAVTVMLPVLALLVRRQRRGLGGFASLSAVESLTRFMGEAFTDRSRGAAPFQRNANKDPIFCPNNAYPCAGTDRWIAISMRDDDDWQRFRRVVQAPALEDPRFLSLEGRRAAEEELDALIAAWTVAHDATALAGLLNAAGVPASPVQTGELLFGDAALQNAGFLPIVEHSHMGRRAVVNTPWEFTRLRAGVRGAAPLLGEANVDVFEKLLGLEPERVERLREKGVIR